MKYILLTCILSLNTYCIKKEKNDSSNISMKNLQLIKSKDRLNNEVGKLSLAIKNTPDSLFESTIKNSVSKMFASKSTFNVDEKIKSIDREEKMSASQKTYWKTYLNYYKSIYYKTMLNDDVKAKDCIEIATELISRKTTTSEDFALLAACYSFSIQFANMTKLKRISTKVEENAQKSLSLNENNLRAYLVLATQNFHTPKMFGGMKKVEDYALKGLLCTNSIDNKYYSPNWGRERLYELLIQYYQLENRLDDMKILKEKYNDNKLER